MLCATHYKGQLQKVPYFMTKHKTNKITLLRTASRFQVKFDNSLACIKVSFPEAELIIVLCLTDKKVAFIGFSLC